MPAPDIWTTNSQLNRAPTSQEFRPWHKNYKSSFPEKLKFLTSFHDVPAQKCLGCHSHSLNQL